MRYLGLLIVLVLLAGVMGCGYDNPVCTESFCVVPRDDVTGEVIEIDDAKALAFLNTLAVDTVPSDNTGTLAEIVDDVNVNGVGSAYKGQTVTISAVAWINYSNIATVNIKGIGLYTHDSKVSCILQDTDGVNDLANIDTGATYTLTIEITDIRESTSTPGDMQILANLVTPPEKTDVVIQDVSIAEIVADVVTGGIGYLKSTIWISATVLIDTGALGNNQGLVLQTGNDKVTFFLIDPDTSDDLTQYTANSTYEFLLYIGSISEDQGEFTITASVSDM